MSKQCCSCWQQPTLPFDLSLPPEKLVIPPEDVSKIRITFNRQLTWSERETLRDWLFGFDEYINHEFTKGGQGKVLIFESLFDSRDAAEIIQHIVAIEFLNIHPRAVKTLRPEVKV